MTDPTRGATGRSAAKTRAGARDAVDLSELLPYGSAAVTATALALDAESSRSETFAAAQSDHFAHTAIRASAGSGKTFQLTNRYLQLIAAGAEPASIFASTFTRLAAGQIRDKILSRLAEAALVSAKRLELSQQLGLDSLPRQTVLDVLVNLARRMHLMHVRTLDSFFASIVKAFAIELEMPLTAEVVDENQAASMRTEAIRLMLDEHDPQSLVELLRLLTQGGSDRGINKTIDRVVSGLYELYREAPAQSWECVPELDGRLSPPKLVAAIERLVETACTGSAQIIKNHKQDCDRARAWDWPAFLNGGLAKAIARGVNAFNRQTIDAKLVAAYTPLVKHAIAELVGRVRSQTIATRDLLALFHIHYEAVKRRRRAITFDDLTAAMGRARKLGTFDDIGFRLDSKIRHVLLDEFQDTSIPQWRALESIVSEIVSVAPPERTFFCVGDVKQSIYGWRDAAPEVLQELPRLFAGPDGQSSINQRDLARSYRSAQVIIDVVNAVFQNLQSNEAVGDFAEAVASWSDGFKHHETEKTALQGYAELRLCRRASDGETAEELRLREAALLAADLHRRNPSISIALLTRSNDSVARLLYELGPSRLNVPTSGRGGGPLFDTAPVNVLLDMLQLADHPDDTVAAFHVACSPAGSIIGLSAFDDDKQRRRVARQIRRALLADGYGRTIAGWVRELAPSCDLRELRRMRQLVELADAHDAHATLRTCDFINVVEQTKLADAQPAPVQVMTIHQSKGLEFDAVILADLEGKLDASAQPAVVYERTKEIGPISRICRYMNQKLREHVPHLYPLFDGHRNRCVRESLSILYVAMTRAIHGLYILTDSPELNKDGSASRRNLKSLSGVIRSALVPHALSPLPLGERLGVRAERAVDSHCSSQPIFTRGEPRWLDRVKSDCTRSPLAPPPIDRIELAASSSPGDSGGQRGWAHKAASKVQANSSLATELKLPDTQAQERGSAIHALFQQIEWLEDFDLKDDHLLAIVQGNAPRRSADWARTQVAAFRRMLNLNHVKQALSRNGSNVSTCHVFREHPFARLIDNRLQTGFIDRLIVHDDADGRPTAATIIDFKTDELAAAQSATSAEQYRPQLETYRAAVSEMFSIDPAAIAMRLLFVHAGIVVEL